MSTILKRIRKDVSDLLGPIKDFEEDTEYYRNFERNRIHQHKMNRKRSNGTSKPPAKKQRRGPKPSAARKHTPVGNPPGKGATSKTRLIVNDGTNEGLATRELENVDLTAIPHSGDNAIDTRQRDSIYVGGFNVKLEVANESTSPTYFSYAIISPLTANVVTNQQFFRYYDNFRSADFGDALTAMEFASLPINADRYHIHMHRTFTLAPASGSSNLEANTTNSYRTIDVWVPFKRQLKFSGGANDTAPESGATYLVYWCDTWGRDAQAASQAGTVSMKKQCITYFREVGDVAW